MTLLVPVTATTAPLVVVVQKAKPSPTKASAPELNVCPSSAEHRADVLFREWPSEKEERIAPITIVPYSALQTPATMLDSILQLPNERCEWQEDTRPGDEMLAE